MSNGEWFYAENGQQIGPFTLDAVRTLLSEGKLKSGDLVWSAGMQDWKPASDVAQLATAYAGSQTPAPAPQTPPQPQVSLQPQAVAVAPLPQPTSQPHVSAFDRPSPRPGFTSAIGYARQEQYAGFWLRFFAYWIDSILLGIVSVSTDFGANVLTHSGSTPFGEAPGGVLVRIVLGWLYYALMESSEAQATLGKLALGIYVTDEEGNRINFARASGRYFGGIVSYISLGIGYMMAGFTEKKQALHDMMAGCLVVRGRATSNSPYAR